VRLATLRSEGLKCGIDGGLFVEPVTLIDSGHTYNRSSIKDYLAYLCRSELPLTCPTTRKPLQPDPKVVTNYAMNSLVAAFVEECGGKEGAEWADIRKLCDDYKTNEAARAAANAPMSPVCTSAYGGFDSESAPVQRAPVHPGSPRSYAGYRPYSPTGLAGPAYSPIRQSPTSPTYSPTSPNYSPTPVDGSEEEVTTPVYRGVDPAFL